VKVVEEEKKIKKEDILKKEIDKLKIDVEKVKHEIEIIEEELRYRSRQMMLIEFVVLILVGTVYFPIVKDIWLSIDPFFRGVLAVLLVIFVPLFIRQLLKW
jgi:hypothetical protein